ncbi:MAG: hypothetical protein ACPGJE_01380 [Wenzhouxiangellaceae bacterium]
MLQNEWRGTLDQGSVLYRINPDSGSPLETIAEIGEDLLSIAVDQDTGEVIGLTAFDSANPDSLVRIDPDSGVVAQLIPLIMPEVEPIPTYLDMFFLEERSDEHSGILFASAIISPPSDPFTRVHSIDPETGEVITGYRLGDARQLPGVQSALAGRANFPISGGTMFGCEEATGDSRLVSFLILLPQTPPLDPPPPRVELDLPNATCVTAGTRLTGFAFYGVLSASDGGRRTRTDSNRSGRYVSHRHYAGRASGQHRWHRVWAGSGQRHTDAEHPGAAVAGRACFDPDPPIVARANRIAKAQTTVEAGSLSVLLSA